MDAELFKSRDSAAANGFTVTFVEIVGAPILIGLLAYDQVITGHEQAMPDGHQGALFTSPCGEPAGPVDWAYGHSAERQ